MSKSSCPEHPAEGHEHRSCPHALARVTDGKGSFNGGWGGGKGAGGIQRLTHKHVFAEHYREGVTFP